MNTTYVKTRKTTRSMYVQQARSLQPARGCDRESVRTIDASNFHMLDRIVEFAIEDSQRPVLLCVTSNPGLCDEVYFHLRESGYRVAFATPATSSTARDDNELDVVVFGEPSHEVSSRIVGGICK